MTLLTNIIAYWKLDESSGNASDSVASYTLTNNNSVSYATGKINNGADFGSSNTNKTLSNSNNLGISSGAITISAWIKPSSLPSSNADPYSTTNFFFVGHANSSVGIMQSLYIYNESGTHKVGFYRTRVGTDQVVATRTHTTSTSTWTHVVGTYDGTTVRIYVNGVEGTSVSHSGTGSGGTDEIVIGRRGISSGFFSGMIDEVGVWNRALSSTEINSLYNSGNGKQYPFIDYTLVMDNGLYSLTGQILNLFKRYYLLLAQGSHVLTGYDLLFQKLKILVMDVGSFVTTGYNSLLLAIRKIILAQGSYILNGQDVTLKKVKTIIMATGSYVLTGIKLVFRGRWINQTKSSNSNWTNDEK